VEQIDGNNAFIAISCSAVNSCTAIDTKNNVLFYS
jgi:hypothetical protein